jgi:hypothetical protein
MRSWSLMDKTSSPPVAPSPSRDRDRDRWTGWLLGLTPLAILLQGIWAGIFLESDPRPESWIGVHARGGELAIVLAAAAAVVTFGRLRRRRDLWLGAAALTVLLVVEAYLGGRITDDHEDFLTPVHVPLAMAIMGLSVWLPLRLACGAHWHRDGRCGPQRSE